MKNIGIGRIYCRLSGYNICKQHVYTNSRGSLYISHRIPHVRFVRINLKKYFVEMSH